MSQQPSFLVAMLQYVHDTIIIMIESVITYFDVTSWPNIIRDFINDTLAPLVLLWVVISLFIFIINAIPQFRKVKSERNFHFNKRYTLILITTFFLTAFSWVGINLLTGCFCLPSDTVITLPPTVAI